MSNKHYLTKEGIEQLKAELRQLESFERPNISKQIGEARDKGDLSENAEYDAAKEAQGLLELKISKLKTKLANARIIDESKLDSSKVLILSKVRLKNHTMNMEITYTLVPDNEVNLVENKISANTPIAKGLLGKEVGDVADIELPNGNVLKLEVLEISR